MTRMRRHPLDIRNTLVYLDKSVNQANSNLVIVFVWRYGAPEPAYAEPEPVEEYAPAPVSEYSAPGYSAPGEVIDIGSLVLPILVVVGESFIINCYSSIG